MKYPPARSAHWDGAVGEWLRAQLGARGVVEARAYARYVLGVLTAPHDRLDDLDLDRDQLSTPRDAAVRCLMDAAEDRNADIEQLVDELCAKLKEVEERPRAAAAAPARKERERSRRPSPGEMARRYYAAFPALVPDPPPPPVVTAAAPPQDVDSVKKRARRKSRRRRRVTLPEWMTDDGSWEHPDDDEETTVPTFANSQGGNNDEGYTTSNDDPVAAFEAKFDRSLEALWRDCEAERGASASIWSTVELAPKPPHDEAAANSADLDADSIEFIFGRPAFAAPSRPNGLDALNHDGARSSFAEVAPTKAPSGFVGDGLLRRRRSAARRRDDDDDRDEDLLTSARTHFRPIEADAREAAAAARAAVDYADGATFPIASDLDAVRFGRSASGSMFLESDAAEPPERYMEYGERVASSRLTLKFRVRQTEKSVQTDRGPPKTEERRFFDFDEEESVVERCESCRSNERWDEGHLRPFVSSHVWSADGAFCAACAEKRAVANRTRPNAVEECSREWDELWSDLRYIHDLKLDDDLRIGSTELSFEARDGDFVESVPTVKKRADDKIESNAVGKILDESLVLYARTEPRCELCCDSSKPGDCEELWRADRKRRHSTVNNGRIRGAGKLRCTLTSDACVPLLSIVDRPLTR